MTALVMIDERLCTACGLCSVRAPSNVEIPRGAYCASIIKQPSENRETRACIHAERICPTGGFRFVRTAERSESS